MANVDPVVGQRVFPELQIDQLTYVPLEHRKEEAVQIRKFLLRCPAQGPVPQDTAARARNCILTLLKNNPALCSVFPLEPQEELGARIAAKKYLIINGDAVCLSKYSFQNPPEMSDQFFSLHLLKHPVRCTQGHLLEAKRARIWAQAKAGMCPVLPEHPIGTLEIDREEEGRIRRFKEEQREHRQDVRTMMERVEQAMAQNQRLGAELQGVVQQQQLQGEREQINGLMMMIRDNQMAVMQGRHTSEIVAGDMTKIGLVTGQKALSWISITAKHLFNKPLVRWVVPGVGAVYACGAAVYRWKHGQPWRAVGEGISGVIGLIPGGSPAKVLLDLTIMGGDINELMNGNQDEIIVIRDLNDAYTHLGLPRDGHPTQGEVHAAYLARLQRVAEDHLGRLGPLYQRYAHTLQLAVNAAKDFIYQHNNWRD